MVITFPVAAVLGPVVYVTAFEDLYNMSLARAMIRLQQETLHSLSSTKPPHFTVQSKIARQGPVLSLSEAEGVCRHVSSSCSVN